MYMSYMFIIKKYMGNEVNIKWGECKITFAGTLTEVDVLFIKLLLTDLATTTFAFAGFTGVSSSSSVSRSSSSTLLLDISINSNDGI